MDVLKKVDELFKVVSVLKETQKNNQGKETEYILSFRIKKEILQKCNEILVNPPTTSSDINKLGYCITILNQYRFYDPVLENITLHFMKQVQKPEELLKRLYIHLYFSIDIIPQPHYQYIKDHVERIQQQRENPIYISQLFSYHCYVLFMIGNVIGFVFVKDNIISNDLFYFESDEVKQIFDNKNREFTYVN
jgi:hypothetical protein